MDPTLEGLWTQVVENWDDDVRHGQFLSYAQATKQLGDAAGLYRSVLTNDSPYRTSANQVADAQRRLAGVAMLAVLDMDAHKSDPTDQRNARMVRIIGLVVVLGLMVGLMSLLLRR